MVNRSDDVPEIKRMNADVMSASSMDTMREVNSVSKPCYPSTCGVLKICDLDIPLLVLNNEGCILEWNRNLEYRTGRLRSSLVGCLLESVVVNRIDGCRLSNEEDMLSETIIEMCGKESGRNKTVSISCLDGSLVVFSARRIPLCCSTEAVVFLLEEQESVEAVSNHAPCSFTVDDFPFPVFSILNKTITGWNSFMEQWTGYSYDSVNTIFIQFHKTTDNLTRVSVTRKDGSKVDWIFHVTPLNNGHQLFAFHNPQDSMDESIYASNHHLTQFLDTLDSPVCGVDLDGVVNLWNRKMALITGCSHQQACHATFLQRFIPQQQHSLVDTVLKNALKGKPTNNFHMLIKTISNDLIQQFYANISTWRDVNDRIRGVLIIGFDVAQQSPRDDALSSMATELRLLIETANAPIFGIDRFGYVNEWNEKMAEITGYTKKQAFRQPFVKTYIFPHLQQNVQDVLDNALHGTGTSNFELEFWTNSNIVRHLLLNATTRRDTENNVVGVLVVAQDVTETIERDRAVAGMAAELRQLIETANAPIFGIDSDGLVNEWNRRTQEITGYAKEEAFDEPLVERFIAPSMRSKVKQVLDDALQGIETSNYELEFLSKSGEPRFLLVNATTRRDPEGNVVGVVGVAQDVTEDRKLTAKMNYLQCSQEAKIETERNITAYFAHELRNPLFAIDSALNSMPEDLPESARTLVAAMQLCTSFMSSIMNNLLDVRKMEEGKMELNKSPLSLKGLLESVHKMLLPAVRPGVSFEYSSLTDGRDWVLGDEHRIQQVLTNVVTNAMKYTLSGSISLSFCWDDNLVKFECSDTGPGIPKSEQEKMFQRFVQRGGAPGTGLGLAIAKHLVDLTGGDIKFISDPSIRAGTTCIVRLPLVLCDAPENPSAPDEALEVEETGMLQEPLRFLIVDDVEMNRKMFKRRIQKGIASNCVIMEASTGESALQIFEREPENYFDVVIVDQYMEEAGGVLVGTDVVYALRRMRVDSIIIGCSGNDLDQEFMEAGADWVWQKPIPSNEKIIAHLRNLLKLRKS